MTTKVTVTASGPCYPARIIKTDGGEEVENRLLPSGETYETWVGTSHTLTVTEEYHEGGYAALASGGTLPPSPPPAPSEVGGG